MYIYFSLRSIYNGILIIFIILTRQHLPPRAESGMFSYKWINCCWIMKIHCIKHKQERWIITHNNLRDHTRLTKRFQNENEEARGDDHHCQLQNEEWEREIQRIIPLPNSISGNHIWNITHYCFIRFIRSWNFLLHISFFYFLFRFSDLNPRTWKKF